MTSKSDKRAARNLNRRIAGYGIAAVGVAALTPAASAQIVYTPTDLTLSNGSLSFDIDANGTPDFNIKNQETNSYYFAGGILFLTGNPQGNNAAIGHQGKQVYEALPVPQGVAIGSSSPASFLTANRSHAPFMAEAAWSYNAGKILDGPFANTTGKYLGLRFQINGADHYGWMRLSTKADYNRLPSIVVKISGYAYETTPGKAIIAGDRGRGAAQSPHVQESGPTLGQLSLGAAGRK